MKTDLGKKIYPERPCRKCGVIFSDSQCKHCVKNNKAEYYRLNSEKIKAQKAVYRHLNKDAILESAAKYFVENKEKILSAQQAHYRKNAERIRRKTAEYRASNKNLVKSASKTYYDSKKLVILAYQDDYRASNPEKISDAGKLYRAANAESIRVKNLNRAVAKNKSGEKLSKDISNRLFILQRGMCPCCKQPLGDDYHMDHKMPIALGGSNTDDNIQLLRARCNLQKNAKHPVDFMQSRGFLL